MSNECVIQGCAEPAVCLDEKGRSWAGLVHAQIKEGERQGIHYCLKHAKEFLFPFIDEYSGNSVEGLVQAFKTDGVWDFPTERQTPPKRRVEPRESLVDLVDEVGIDFSETGEE